MRTAPAGPVLSRASRASTTLLRGRLSVIVCRAVYPLQVATDEVPAAVWQCAGVELADGSCGCLCHPRSCDLTQ
jgi:hypothetical protein